MMKELMIGQKVKMHIKSKLGAKHIAAFQPSSYILALSVTLPCLSIENKELHAIKFNGLPDLKLHVIGNDRPNQVIVTFDFAKYHRIAADVLD